VALEDDRDRGGKRGKCPAKPSIEHEKTGARSPS
jgi:hypothetical protein